MMFKLFEYPFIDTWCNGSTTDFGSVSSGSNPDVSTIKYYSIMKKKILNFIIYVFMPCITFLYWIILMSIMDSLPLNYFIPAFIIGVILTLVCCLVAKNY